MMAGFESGSTGVGSDLYANCVATTAQKGTSVCKLVLVGFNQFDIVVLSSTLTVLMKLSQ